MSQSVLLIVVAVILFALVPLVPKMVVLRVKVLRWLTWNRLADWHERHARGITLAVRIIFIAIAAVLMVSGITA